jgi:hypothetical protein
MPARMRFGGRRIVHRAARSGVYFVTLRDRKSDRNIVTGKFVLVR